MIDATGLVVSPGMVDAHVHINGILVVVTDEWEGWSPGTAASAKGGADDLYGNAFKSGFQQTVIRPLMTNKAGENKPKVEM